VLRGARADHLDLVLAKLADAGADIAVQEDGLRVRMDARARAVDFVTLPYPGFPTDLQPQMMANAFAWWPMMRRHAFALGQPAWRNVSSAFKP